MEQKPIERFPSIGESIKNRRKEKGMTQIELSEATGISLTSLKKYEQGTRMPKLEALIKLNEVLDLNQEILLFNSSPQSEKEKETELPKIKEFLSNKNFKLLSQEEIEHLTQEINKALDEYCQSTSGTGSSSAMINSEKKITHKLFDDIMMPYDNQPIFDIIKVLAGYLSLNCEGEKLVLDFLKACSDTPNLVQKNYDPSVRRPIECKRPEAIRRQGLQQ